MVKLNFYLKIYIFLSQFHLTSQEKKYLRYFNIFVFRVYVKYSFNAQSIISAPRNDFNLLKKLIEYKNINKKIAEIAIKSFSNRFWYLSESLINLAFLNNQVIILEKESMVTALLKEEDEDFPKHIKLDERLILSMALYDFVTNSSNKLFTALNLPHNFLKNHPSTWENYYEYIQLRKKIQELKVVNCTTECETVRFQSFNPVY